MQTKITQRRRGKEPLRSLCLLERTLRPHVPVRRGGAMYVADLMTPSPICIQPEDTLRLAWDWMDEAEIRHLPVVDEESSLVGILSHRDLARHALAGLEQLPASTMASYLERRTVAAAMVLDPQTTEPTERADEAGMVLWEEKIGCLPVVEGRRVVGILTEADFVRFAIELSREG